MVMVLPKLFVKGTSKNYDRHCEHSEAIWVVTLKLRLLSR
jgi:hypothetical protein